MCNLSAVVCDSLSRGLAAHSLIFCTNSKATSGSTRPIPLWPLPLFVSGYCGNVLLSVGVCVCAFSHCSQMVATCGYQDIRIWNLNDHCELLRISVPNMTCHSVTITVDGKSIISGQSFHITVITVVVSGHLTDSSMSPRRLNETPPASTDCHPNVSFYHIQCFNFWSRRSIPT